MIVVSQKFLGLTCCCSQCGILFSFKKEDVFENKWVYCPVCRAKNDAMVDYSYNGVVKDYSASHKEE